jgi:ribosomal protein S18 acetylase RimI-like enzyme
MKNTWTGSGRRAHLVHFATMEPSGGVGAAKMRNGTEADAPEAAKLHVGQIDEGFLASLGPRFLTRLYRRVALFEGSFLLIADVSGTTIGFLAGALDLGALYKRFILSDGAPAAIASAPRLIRAWPRALETLHRGSSEKAPPGTAELLSVAVDPTARGHGAGTLLVSGFIDEASRKGASAAQVVVGADNHRAVSLYSRSGFEQVDDFELHPGTRSLLMRRSLPEAKGTGAQSDELPRLA